MKVKSLLSYKIICYYIKVCKKMLTVPLAKEKKYGKTLRLNIEEFFFWDTE